MFGSVGSISGSRPELRGQGHRARHLAGFAIAGGISGGLLLLATPPQAFAKIVPWLIGLASLAILIRPDRSRAPFPVGQRPTRALSAGVFLVGVYGGYFGAAAGVILLALLLISTSEVLARSNALKTSCWAWPTASPPWSSSPSGRSVGPPCCPSVWAC